MKRPVIGLAGLAGCGKSTVADHLIEKHGFARVKFAGPLKDMLRALGLSERHLEGDLKEKPCDLLCGKTPRQAMIWLGTEYGREMIGQDLWIRAWKAACDRFEPGRPVVADDCRFPNEAEAVRSISPFSLVIRIQRSGGTVEVNHVSELQAFPADVTIRNDSTVADLLAEVDRLVLHQKFEATA